MTHRLAAITFILVCTSIAWSVLAGSIDKRTYQQDESLRDRVASSWGKPQQQHVPAAVGTYTEKRSETTTDLAGKSIVRTWDDRKLAVVPLESTRASVALELEHRQKGLLWYSTYKVRFAAKYVFRNDTPHDLDVTYTLRYPAAQAIYDDLIFTLDGKALPITNEKDAATVTARLAAGKTAVLDVGYRSQGLDTWHYRFGSDVAQVRDFQLVMTTDFADIDFPENTLSPTEKKANADGWELRWDYRNLLSGYAIGMVMPEKLQPGPLAGRISFFAPVSLLFFFFLMFIITTLREIDLHPMNYFFLAAAFFAFHLLLAYLVDHISIHAAFVISSAVSVFLVVSYLRLVTGMRFAAVEAASAQLIYLVLFSYAFFFKGFTGLAITIGSILTLFVVMQMTGRIKWSERFAGQPVKVTG
jgi:inner membrane protein involved in colicin E2 resistance